MILVLQNTTTKINLVLNGSAPKSLSIGASTTRINLNLRTGTEGPQGLPGVDGKEVQLQATSTHIQWKYTDSSVWSNLVALSTITGPQGDEGPQGPAGTNGTNGTNATNPSFSVATGSPGSSVTLSGTYPNLLLTIPRGDVGATGLTGATGPSGDDGREVELQASLTHIQWRYVGDVSWTNLVTLSSITGPQGPQGDPGTNGTNATNPSFSVATGAAGSSVTISGSYPNLTLTIPRGDTGATGLQGIPGDEGPQGPPGSFNVITGTANINFEDNETIASSVVTNALLTNANMKSFSWMPQTNADHESFDDFAVEGISVFLESIQDNTNFTLRASSNSGTWGQYSIKYSIAY